jgi:hypothetical protein
MGGTVLSVSSRALVGVCERLGLDIIQILAAARLDRATLEDPDSRIHIEQVEVLCALFSGRLQRRAAFAD